MSKARPRLALLLLLMSVAAGGGLIALGYLGAKHRRQGGAIALRDKAVRAGPSLPLPSGSEGDATPPALLYRITNATLAHMSTNNEVFQEWGSNFMLRAANDFLSKVPLYGLKGPLLPGKVAIRTLLTTMGAEIDLATQDGKYAIYYDHGMVAKAVAFDGEMTEIFRRPSVYEHLSDNVGSWSPEEARRAAEAIIAAKGIDIRAMGGKPKAIVKPETFKLPTADGLVKRTTVFYTVRWMMADVDDCDVLEIRFRRAAAGDWEITEWSQAPVGPREMESTDFGALYSRFFGDLTPGAARN